MFFVSLTSILKIFPSISTALPLLSPFSPIFIFFKSEISNFFAFSIFSPLNLLFLKLLSPLKADEYSSEEPFITFSGKTSPTSGFLFFLSFLLLLFSLFTLFSSFFLFSLISLFSSFSLFSLFPSFISLSKFLFTISIFKFLFNTLEILISKALKISSCFIFFTASCDKSSK